MKAVSWLDVPQRNLFTVIGVPKIDHPIELDITIDRLKPVHHTTVTPGDEFRWVCLKIPLKDPITYIGINDMILPLLDNPPDLAVGILFAGTRLTGPEPSFGDKILEVVHAAGAGYQGVMKAVVGQLAAILRAI